MFKTAEPNHIRQDFADIFESYKNLVYRTAYLILGDPNEADDALQEVFLNVYRNIDAYDPEKGAFSTWIHRVTVNQCLNRKRKRRPDTMSDQEMDTWQFRVDFSPEKVVEATDTLNTLLEGLSDKLRAVMVLRYAWDLSYADIADILELPLGTVQSRIHLGTKAVQEKLAARKETRS